MNAQAVGSAIDLDRHLDRVLLARYAPPGVLINQKMEILQFRGETEAFLQAAPGKPLNELMTMARHGLLPALRATIAQAMEMMGPVTRSGVEVDQDGFTRVCNLVVFPLARLTDTEEPFFVVLFEEVGRPGTVRSGSAGNEELAPTTLSPVDIDALKHQVSEAQRARAEAERATKAKDMFLAILGHELRTPLTSLLLQAQMLRRTQIVDASRLTRVGELIERSTRMQMQVVDDLLDVSRIIAGKLKVELRPVDVTAIVKAALELVIDVAQRKSIRLEVGLDQSVGAIAGDPSRLRQVVSNLLTNAIKFTPNNGRVAVTLDTADGCARIQVQDTGFGIEAAFLPYVFNRFSQEASANVRAHGGLGLGLAIVRHLVEQHGGKIQATSPGVGKGSTFTVTLPFIKAESVSRPKD